MKKVRITILLALALVLLTAGTAQALQAYTDYGASYDNLIGAMEIVNCTSWASLRYLQQQPLLHLRAHRLRVQRG